MSDTNTISLTYSKDLQPLIDTAINDFRQYLKDKIQNELTIEQAKIKASKEKWDSALKTLNKNGAFDKVMLQAANKFMGEPQSHKTDDDYLNRIKNAKSARVNKPNLVSLIAELDASLNSEPELRKSMNSVIDKISVHASVFNLFKCSCEDDALATLNYIRSNIVVDDIPYLINLNNALNSLEKELVVKILNFEP